MVPGQANAVLTYLVTNTGNAAEGFQLSATNLGGTLFGTRRQRGLRDAQTCSSTTPAPWHGGRYDAGFDTVANHRHAGQGRQRGGVRGGERAATARPTRRSPTCACRPRSRVPGTNGATLEVETAGADTAGVDIVFGDAGRDATETADDQYFVTSAALTISKTSAVISDPFNGTAPTRKAIPGAVIEYVVTIANTGAAAAGSVQLSDTLDANLAFVPGALQRRDGRADPGRCRRSHVLRRRVRRRLQH